MKKAKVINIENNINNQRYWSVYMHTCILNNKRYIGITSMKPERRWGSNGNMYKNSPHFWNAIQKYGWDNFKHEIILKNETFEYACAVEKCLIKHYKTKNPNFGYNMTDGGEGMCGWNPSVEWRQKQSEIKKGKPLSDDVKQKISLANIGHPVSVETRQKISKNHADFSGENHPQYGTHPTEETRKKISEKLKEKCSNVENCCFYGRQHTEESKEKMRKSHTGKKHTEETKKKISDWQKEHPQTKAKWVRCKETGQVYKSINEAQRKLGIYHIGECCRDVTKSARGLHFEFVDKESVINGSC